MAIRPDAQLVSLSIDANDPPVMARFWSAALGWKVRRRSFTDIALKPTDGTPFVIELEHTPDPWAGLGRMHLDLTTTSEEDQQDTVARLLELGGRHLDVGQGPDDRHVVLADPEGNELCIIEPENRFLAGCPRIGALSCDGRRETGVFWSQALGWPLVWDQDEETAIRHPDGIGPFITWGGPPLRPKHGKNRFHIDIAPAPGVSQADEVERLLALGASRADIGQGDTSWVVMADPDGNEFCVLKRR
jgi:catechol 2,3-dioxygenase-like lactoylglutathione lyase family enzyme